MMGFLHFLKSKGEMTIWHYAYPYVWTLLNGGILDDGDIKSKSFDIICPDEGRVHLHGEVIEEN